jgi:hypothetical protein
VTTAAAAATFVAQRDVTGVAARLLTGMRTVGALSMSLPIIAAGVLSYHEVLRNGKPTPPEPTEPSTRVAATVLAGVALALFLLVLATWWRTRGDEKQEEVTSPWDMSLQARPDRDAGRRRHALTYTQALTAYGFDRAAVGIRSSEGWHHVYGWSDSNHEEALAALERLAGENREALGYRCGDPADCPHVGDSGCRLGYRTGTSNVARGDLDRRDTADAGSSHASVGPNGSRPSSGTGT